MTSATGASGASWRIGTLDGKEGRVWREVWIRGMDGWKVTVGSYDM